MRELQDLLRSRRANRQPTLLRCERSLAQVNAALEHTRGEIADVRAGRKAAPVMINGAAPPPELNDAAPPVGVAAYLTSLCRREEGLRRVCEQLREHVRAGRVEADALGDKRVRTARLQALLDRCRVVYEVCSTLWALSPVLQAAHITSPSPL